MATILVVDDRQTNRALVCTVLSYGGHDSVEATSGDKALEMLRGQSVDLLITDILMPGMDGYELVREMRSDPALAPTPVVFYTANYNEDEARPIAQSLGVQHVIAKTGDTEELLAAVHDALDESPVQLPRHSAAQPAGAAFAEEHLEVLKAKLVERTQELEDRRRLERVVDAALAISDDLSLTATLDRLVSAARSLLRAGSAVVEMFCEEHPGAAPSDTPGQANALLRAHGETVGLLRVGEPLNGADFDEDDRQLLEALAGAAGRAIRNAKLYEDSRRREAWLKASADITSTLLSADPSDALALVAASARAISDSDLVWIEVAAGPTHVSVEACEGAREALLGATIPVEAAPLFREVEALGKPVVLADASGGKMREGIGGLGIGPLGPLMALPLLGTQRCLGALLIGRGPRSPRFTAIDVEMAAAFAGQAALALEFAQARKDRERLALAEDRNRIGRDLHDTVVQRLYLAGLRMDRLSAYVQGTAAADLVEQIGDDVDEAIRDIRVAIYSVRNADEQTGLRSELVKLAARARDSLGFHPRLQVEGPAESAIDERTQQHLVAVVTEALSNAARHARATRLELVVRLVAGHLTVTIADNGVGLAEHRTESGLANMRQRAAELGGQMSLGTGIDGRGARIVWSVPAVNALAVG